MQSLYQENRRTLRKIPCRKQRVIQRFIRNTDPAVSRTEKQRIYLHKEIRIYCIKSCNHARPRTRICSLLRIPTFFEVKVGLRRRLGIAYIKVKFMSVFLQHSDKLSIQIDLNHYSPTKD